MLLIYCAPSLYRNLGTTAAVELATLIREWKEMLPSGKIVTHQHYFFGRDKRNLNEQGSGLSYASHAHLEPVHEPAKGQWGAKFDDGALPEMLVGGRVLSYSLDAANAQRGMYLLNIHNDPGGHKALFHPKNSPVRVAYGKAAEDHQLAGKFVVPPIPL